MKRIFALAVAVLAGCAVQQIELNQYPTATYQSKYSKVVVDNLSTIEKIRAGDVVYVNGWAPMHGGFSPALNLSFGEKLKASLVPGGGGGKLEIAVLRVGLFVEKSVADDVILVGILGSGRDRGFKCSAEINIKTDSDSRRFTVEHQIKRPYFKERSEIQQFVDDCHGELIRKIVEAAEFVST